MALDRRERGRVRNTRPTESKQVQGREDRSQVNVIGALDWRALELQMY